MSTPAAAQAFRTRDSIRDVWGERTPYRGDWPVRADAAGAEEPQRWVQSCCLLCSNGCGLDIGVTDGRMVAVRGREVDRVNHGRLGPKGLHGWVANHSSDRLTRPLIRRGGRLEPASWDEAMGLIVERARHFRQAYGSSSIGFYTSGQLFIEEYYTLAVIGKAGLGTPHMDGNTRLCTATAAMAMNESFGSDGQPGSYRDFDLSDAFLMVGHNMAETQTVLWARVLDRLAGPLRPRLVVVDPRRTETARRADVHLDLKVGTNVALLNGLLHLLIRRGHVDEAFIREHTLGFEKLREAVLRYTPKAVREICGVDCARLEEAAEIVGTAPTLVSTVLQGVYQSHQATAAAVQVNNINLVRGMIGKPGCSVFQFNGQPTAQNTRETGCNGEMTAFRNWDNPAHIEQLAKLWNVDPAIIPHWAPPTHAVQIFRYCETGSIRMLWVSATNPAVSMPDLARIRRIMEKGPLFLVVQDGWRNETTEFADVVLPAAIWGEKTGTYTNVDRTVHISHKAVEPPGEARSDLDIWLDFARRMDFKDKDGAPLVKWDGPEPAFEAFKQATRGRPCDYTGLTYSKLTGGSGIQWPCNGDHPEGRERLYEDGVFRTDPGECGSYGHDLMTGAATPPEDYRAMEPGGRAFLKWADYIPLHEEPDKEYPFLLTTGRVVYHWHTRTKTARSEELRAASPDAFVELSAQDAAELGVEEGDWVRVTSRRASVYVRARLGEIKRGHAFIPFHFGYWDRPDHLRAANELTLMEWDPVSKQPYFKFAAVRLEKVSETEARDTGVAEGRLPDTQGVKAPLKEALSKVKGKVTARGAEVRGPEGPVKREMHVGTYVKLLRDSEQAFIQACREVRREHAREPDMNEDPALLARWSEELVSELKPFMDHYHEEALGGADVALGAGFNGPRSGSLGLLRDLQDLWIMAQESDVCFTALLAAAQGLRDKELEAYCRRGVSQTRRQIAWLRTRIKQAAPQTLIVPT